jgi:2-polyprenyl-6-methoxyphenol hydroxylase-like FAD-dependent oxidoreductase
MERAQTALVIGGGIAGPVAAMALRKAGIEATVYEAYGETAHGIGGELMLAPNGMAALAVIDVADRVAAAGIPMPRMVMETGTGKRLGEFHDLPGLPTSHLFARADLYRALLDAAVADGVPFAYAKRLVELESTDTGVTATFADGSKATADVLIGADGIRSTVRKLLDPHAPSPRYVGLLGLGAWVDDAGLAPTGGAMHFAFGKRAFFGYSVEAGHAGWFANLPSAQPLTADEARRIPDEEWLRRLQALYAGDTLPALRMLDRVGPGDLVNVGAMHDMPPVPVWHRGRAVLVGDAAHATSPSSGQGASLAVESAIELARCLRDQPVHEAFDAYERLRRPRVERVNRRTARVNRDKAPGPIGRLLRDVTFPIAMRTFYNPEKMMGWMHRYTIDWDTPVPAVADHA